MPNASLDQVLNDLRRRRQNQLQQILGKQQQGSPVQDALGQMSPASVKHSPYMTALKQYGLKMGTKLAEAGSAPSLASQVQAIGINPAAYPTLTGQGATGIAAQGPGVMSQIGAGLSSAGSAIGAGATAAAQGVSSGIGSLMTYLAAFSTARMKHEIAPLEHRDIIQNLTPVSFRYLGDSETLPGLIAEQVAEHAPELVFRDDEGKPLGIHYTLLIPLLIEEIQTLHARIEALEGQT